MLYKAQAFSALGVQVAGLAAYEMTSGLPVKGSSTQGLTPTAALLILSRYIYITCGVVLLGVGDLEFKVYHLAGPSSVQPL